MKFKYLLHFMMLCQLEVSKLFNSLILSLTLYGNEFWGAAPKGNYLDRVEKF
jgi:hypothetical protein